MGKRKKQTITYTKKIVSEVLVVSIISANLPYILAYLDKEPVAELGIAWVTAVVAVCLGYFIRGFKDSKSEAEHNYKMRKAGFYNNDDE